MSSSEISLQAARFGLSMLVIIPGIYASVWLDSKLGADLQARVGPSRTGAAGWLQPFADFLSLLRKYRPGGKGEHGTLLWWAEGLPLFALVALTPIGRETPLLSTGFSVFFALFMAIAHSWAGLWLTWGSGTLEARFASLRQAALGAAGLPAAFLSLLQAGFSYGGLSWQKVEASQGWAPWSWLAFQGPFAAVSALVFLSAGLILFSVPPFYLGNESLRWVVAAHPGESGVRQVWLRLSRRVAHFCWVLLAVRIFFGGASLPEGLLVGLGVGVAGFQSIAIGVTLLKALCLIAGLSILARTLPSVRSDQAHDFAWRVLSPMALIALLGARLVAGGGAS